MMAIIEPPDETGATALWQRLLWFAGLWLGGVMAVGCVATLLRSWLLG